MHIGSYILTEEIGSGAHGVVYKGYHKERMDEVLAVKVIHNTGNLDKLLIEPDLLSQLNHPNILSLKNYFLDTDRLILVTEYIDGVDLQSYLNQKGRLHQNEVKIFLTQMADALAYAHSRNIIHRDIKPSNILVSIEQGETRFILSDFGVSRIAQGIQTSKRVAGTYHYMAPEQLRGRPCEQSDLWALGVCLYTLLTGTKPFQGETLEGLSKEISLTSPKLISEYSIEIDQKFEKIIFQLLKRELFERTSSATSLLRELKDLDEPILQKLLPKLNPAKKSSQYTWYEKDLREFRRNWILVFVFIFLGSWYLSLSNIILSLVSLSGVIVFYLGQLKSNDYKSFIGLLLLGLSFLLIGFAWQSMPGVDISILSFLSKDPNSALSITFTSLGLLGYPAAGYFFSKAKYLKDVLVLHEVMRNSLTDREKLLSSLKRYIDINWTNISLRQKYIELLLMDGKLKEAVIEAELSLKVDPYNFGINLLLANGYYDCGLYDDCVRVCDTYLALVPYSFEFDVLRKQCKKIRKGNED